MLCEQGLLLFWKECISQTGVDCLYLYFCFCISVFVFVDASVRWKCAQWQPFWKSVSHPTWCRVSTSWPRLHRSWRVESLGDLAKTDKNKNNLKMPQKGNLMSIVHALSRLEKVIFLERFSNILWVFTVPHEKFKQMLTRLRWNSSYTKLSKFSTPRDMFSWLSFPPREPDTSLHWTPDARSWPARGWKTGGWGEIGRAGARCQDIRFRILVLAGPCFSDNLSSFDLGRKCWHQQLNTDCNEHIEG